MLLAPVLVLVLVPVLLLVLVLVLILALLLWWCLCCCCRRRQGSRHYYCSCYRCGRPQCLCPQLMLVLVLVQLQHPRQRLQRLQQLLAWRQEQERGGKSLQGKCDLVLASPISTRNECPSLQIRYLPVCFPRLASVISIRDGQVRWASWAVVDTAEGLVWRSIGCARDGRDMNDAAAARPGSRGEKAEARDSLD